MTVSFVRINFRSLLDDGGCPKVPICSITVCRRGRCYVKVQFKGHATRPTCRARPHKFVVKTSQQIFDIPAGRRHTLARNAAGKIGSEEEMRAAPNMLPVNSRAPSSCSPPSSRSGLGHFRPHVALIRTARGARILFLCTLPIRHAAHALCQRRNGGARRDLHAPPSPHPRNSRRLNGGRLPRLHARRGARTLA